MPPLTIKTTRRNEMLDVTRLVQERLAKSEHDDGIVICFVPHTTAGITINESADPDVCRDLLDKLGREIPQEDGYRHAEGNSDSHLKSLLTGSSVLIPFEAGQLQLGRWQGIFFCEFDGPRTRQLIIKVGKLS